MALEGLGQWRRLRLPEMRKQASPGRLAAKGGPREVAWGRLCAETSSGLLYIGGRGRFPRWWIRTPANRLSVVAGGRGGDECLQTSEGMSPDCSRG